MKEQTTVYVLKEPETGWYLEYFGGPLVETIHQARKFEWRRSAELASRYITRAKMEIVAVRITYEEVEG